MKLLNDIRDYLAQQIRPKVSHTIGYRERIASLVASQQHYTIVLMTDGKREEEMAYLTFQNCSERGSPGVLFQGNAPSVGDKVKLDLFLPGIACYVPYGIHEMPVRDVNPSFGMLEVVVHTEDMQRKAA